MDPSTEDNKQDQPNTNAPSGGNVMDVQPPTTPTAPQPTPSAPAPVPQSGPIQPPTPEVQPEQPEPQTGGLNPDLLAQAQAEIQKPTTPNPDEKLLAAHTPHKKGRKLVVGLAVLVALALAGVAVYAYIQSQDKNNQQDTHDTEHQESSEEHAEPASAKDVEDTAHELDETINATDEAEEIPGDGLSEDTVGL